MVDGMDFVDGVDIDKILLRGCVHPVHDVHSVRCLEKSTWLQLPNVG